MPGFASEAVKSTFKGTSVGLFGSSFMSNSFRTRTPITFNKNTKIILLVIAKNLNFFFHNSKIKIKIVLWVYPETSVDGNAKP